MIRDTIVDRSAWQLKCGTVFPTTGNGLYSGKEPDGDVSKWPIGSRCAEASFTTRVQAQELKAVWGPPHLCDGPHICSLQSQLQQLHELRLSPADEAR